MFRVARRYRFSASHRLHSPELSAEQNAELYGKCNNPFGHGHDYTLEVMVKGDRDRVTGLVVPVRRLDEYVRRTVIDEFDHKNLNEQVAPFDSIPPTTENIGVEMAKRLRAGWTEVFRDSPALDGIRVLETRRNSVTLDLEDNR